MFCRCCAQAKQRTGEQQKNQRAMAVVAMASLTNLMVSQYLPSVTTRPFHVCLATSFLCAGELVCTANLTVLKCWRLFSRARTGKCLCSLNTEVTCSGHGCVRCATQRERAQNALWRVRFISRTKLRKDDECATARERHGSLPRTSWFSAFFPGAMPSARPAWHDAASVLLQGG